MPSIETYATEMLLSEGLLCGHALARLAEAGRVIFLLDGLDEYVASMRHQLLDDVRALRERYPRARIIATTRLGEDLNGRPFDEILRLAPLSDAAITSLLTSWCELYERQRAGTGAAAQRGRLEASVWPSRCCATRGSATSPKRLCSRRSSRSSIASACDCQITASISTST